MERPSFEAFENQDHTPLNADLVPAIPYEDMTRTHIMELENRPDVIVRLSPSESPDDDLDEQIESARGDLVMCDRLLEELTNKYDIQVVPHRHIIGSMPDDPNQMATYTITDRVFGTTLDESIQKPTPILGEEELTKHFLGLIRYHVDIRAHGGPYLSDIVTNNSQFMYGNTMADPEDRIYLTDIEPFIDEYNAEHPDRTMRDTLERCMGTLAYCIAKAESLSGYELKAVKEAYMEQLGEMIRETNEYYSYIQGIARSLEQANA
jgi:hypothetical protein